MKHLYNPQLRIETYSRAGIRGINKGRESEGERISDAREKTVGSKREVERGIEEE